jgi:hypothetical protein
MIVSRATLLLAVLLSFSCKDKNASKSIDINVSNASDSIAKPVHDSIAKSLSPKTYLKVSAHLIYDDGTLSTFDVLNDKSIALWNVIAGEGDALKPSTSTKISLDGNLDSLNVKIKNGRKLVIDATVIHFEKHLEYVLKKTGCAEVNVYVTRNKKLIYNDTILFHCGE